MMSYRIVLADDHAILREGIKSIINATERLSVVGEASDGLELIRLLRKVDTDMAILDISMPNLRGIEALHEIKAHYPHIKVLILSMHKKKEYLQRVLSAGAEGFLLKEDTGNELVNAISAIRKGGTFLSPIFLKEYSQDLIGICRGARHDEKELLSHRERQVLELIVEGKTSQEIAMLLYISVRTVQHHRANIRRKLNIKKTVDLVRYAMSHGYAGALSEADS
ncbi:MAG: response regulator transcription factor [Desulfobacterales bacterium]|jgi:DNA-binding NarL/FixJ family response regulator|nr:response regulator transcription factor [Desulfobacterales bacterium]